MANTTKKSSTGPSASDDNVVRIKAGSSTKKPVVKTGTVPAADTPQKPAKAKRPRTAKSIPGAGFLKPVGGYFKGAWVELRQVRWPNRRATWSLTGAVLAYSAFFVVLVLLLDALFKFLFDLILKK